MKRQNKLPWIHQHHWCCIKYLSLLASVGLLASTHYQYSLAFSIKTTTSYNDSNQHNIYNNNPSSDRRKAFTSLKAVTPGHSSLVGGGGHSGGGGITTGTDTNSNNRMVQIRKRMNDIVIDMMSSSSSTNDEEGGNNHPTEETTSSSSSAAAPAVGRLEELKQREAELSALLAEVRREKLATIRSRPLTIGIVGYGRFGQFIAKTFTKYGNVIVTSRTDYTDIANSMNAKYIPMNHLDQFLDYDLDVIVIATSIVSFESSVKMLAPYIERHINKNQKRHSNNNINGQTTSNSNKDEQGLLLRGPLVVDVLSVKEHARQVMIQYLPSQCDILCTHPMFGPDSGKDGWYNLNFVYEKTRIDQVILSSNQQQQQPRRQQSSSSSSSSPSRKKRSRHNETETFIDEHGMYHSVHEGSDAHVEGMDRMERFLSIWEEEGCKMVPMSCIDHDAYAANSQFITHLIGRVLANQGLESTPIDTAGFQSVLRLITNTVSDSFDLFYGLYKYNRKNSYETIQQLQVAMNEVVTKLQQQEDDNHNPVSDHSINLSNHQQHDQQEENTIKVVTPASISRDE